jgi:hypothetical protein
MNKATKGSAPKKSTDKHPAPKSKPAQNKADKNEPVNTDEVTVIEPEHEVDPATIEDTHEKNAVGQNIDKKITQENDVYLTPENKRMIIQMEDEDNQMVFAGEHGKKAKWYSMDVLKNWVKQN